MYTQNIDRDNLVGYSDLFTLTNSLPLAELR